MEYPEHIKEAYKNAKIDIFSAIELIDFQIKCGLGTEDVTMLPMDGVAVKILLEDCKKRYKYEQHKVVCKNCRREFITYARTDRYYCDSPAPQDPTKTCAEIGPKLIYQQRYHDDSDWYSWYRKTYQLIQNRVRRNPEKYKSKLFEDFKRDTRQWIEDVKKGRKASSEFIQWLKQYREKLHIKKPKHQKEENKKLSYEDKIISELTEKDLEV